MYKVFFQIGKKKMLQTIEADSKEDAKQKFIDSIKFHKIESEKLVNPEVEKLKNIFGMS